MAARPAGRQAGPRLLACLLLGLAVCTPTATALWPRPEAYTLGSRTLCLARDLEASAAGPRADQGRCELYGMRASFGEGRAARGRVVPLAAAIAAACWHTSSWPTAPAPHQCMPVHTACSGWLCKAFPLTSWRRALTGEPTRPSCRMMSAGGVAFATHAEPWLPLRTLLAKCRGGQIAGDAVNPACDAHLPARYQGIIRDLPLGLGRNPRHNNSLGWLDGLTDDALAARLLAELGAASAGGDSKASGAARRDELAAAGGSAAGAGAGARRKRCHLVRTIEVSVTSSDQVRVGWAL